MSDTITIKLTSEQWMAAHRVLTHRKGWRVARYEGVSVQEFLKRVGEDKAMVGEAVLAAMQKGGG